MTDPWGVDRGYEDTERRWHETSAETRRAIHAAMGIEDGAPPPSPEAPVRVVRVGTEMPWPESGKLFLEDGATLHLDGRLPADLPPGYHEFRSDRGARSIRLIASPGLCLKPQRCWGWSAQLYATRSAESWGMGDLADLRRLARWSAGMGAGMILVNPLGAATPLLPQQASPYYPSSRRFLNPLYLRVEEAPGATELGASLERWSAAGRALNDAPLLDRDAIFRLKHEALRTLWERFPGNSAFEEFCRQRGSELETFATYCVLATRLGGDWRTWPAEYRTPQGAAVAEFARAHAREVGYHQWLQWLLERQLAEAAEALPLVQDLPVGVDPGGVDAWMWQDLLAKDCTVGAPPDAFNAHGQNWALPPFIPHKLRAAGYEPFIQTLRAALRRGGGLRIDHVMGLFRLFWIPEGFGPERGAYVRYPADELLAIVALESWRAGAFVVGEDLGTVEPGVRERLAAHNILSFRLLWFEEDRPARYPELAMAAISTHDLPTVAGLWNGQDLAAQRAVGLHVEEEMGQMRRRFRSLTGLRDEASVAEAIERAYQTLATAPSLVLLATLDDALAVSERPNIPGTTSERPNWSIPLPGGLDALESSSLGRRIAAALDRE